MNTERTAAVSDSPGMDHLVQLGDFKLRVGDDWEAQGRVLRVIHILDPFQVFFDGVGTQPDRLHTAFRELFAQL